MAFTYWNYYFNTWICAETYSYDSESSIFLITRNSVNNNINLNTQNAKNNKTLIIKKSH